MGWGGGLLSSRPGFNTCMYERSEVSGARVRTFLWRWTSGSAPTAAPP